MASSGGVADCSNRFKQTDKQSYCRNKRSCQLKKRSRLRYIQLRRNIQTHPMLRVAQRPDYATMHS